MMKIQSVNVNLVEVPDECLCYGEAARLPVKRPVITVSLNTDQGTQGIGITFIFKGIAGPICGFTDALFSATKELAEQTIGENPEYIDVIISKLQNHAEPLAYCGLFLTAVSAIDTALWDLKGKHAGLPLWRLLGGKKASVPTYASGALHRQMTDEQIVEEGARLVDIGFRYLKLHLALDGEPDPAKEVRRAQMLRNAVGPHINIMGEVNNRWGVGQTINMNDRLRNIDLFCIEDPVRQDDFSGMAHVTRSTTTQIMAGESWWGSWSFQTAFQQRSVDIAMIDLMHVGGITPWMKIANTADFFNIQVVSHLVPEFQAHLISASPNGLLCEHKEWIWRLFDGCPSFENGSLVLSERPGLGIAFSKEFKDCAGL
jgi:L-alanine-DL-glutamate epimerase-like enolase superfamily enzyme